jgi:hypothetical protein
MTTLPEYKAAMEKLKEDAKLETSYPFGDEDEATHKRLQPIIESLMLRSAHLAAEFVSGRVEDAHLTDTTMVHIPRAMGKATINKILHRQLDAARTALADVKGEGK